MVSVVHEMPPLVQKIKFKYFVFLKPVNSQRTLRTEAGKFRIERHHPIGVFVSSFYPKGEDVLLELSQFTYWYYDFILSGFGIY